MAKQTIASNEDPLANLNALHAHAAAARGRYESARAEFVAAATAYGEVVARYDDLAGDYKGNVAHLGHEEFAGPKPVTKADLGGKD